MTIYHYDDFRKYLNNLFLQAKKDDATFTYRSFAQKAGFSNPGFLVDVLKGRRKLSHAAIKKIITGFDLSPHEAEYFTLLVTYGQTKKDAERAEIYRTMLTRRNRSNFVKVDASCVKYYQNPLYALVRNAVDACDFRGDFNKLGDFFDPPAPGKKIQACIDDLLTWKMIELRADGSYHTVNQLVEPPKTLDHLVKEMNKEWISQAHNAISRVPADKRHISSMIFAVSNKTRDEILARIEEFRQEIFARISADPTPECVMQLSMQLFPKSKTGVH